MSSSHRAVVLQIEQFKVSLFGPLVYKNAVLLKILYKKDNTWQLDSSPIYSRTSTVQPLNINTFTIIKIFCQNFKSSCALFSKTINLRLVIMNPNLKWCSRINASGVNTKYFGKMKIQSLAINRAFPIFWFPQIFKRFSSHRAVVLQIEPFEVNFFAHWCLKMWFC